MKKYLFTVFAVLIVIAVYPVEMQKIQLTEIGVELKIPESWSILEADSGYVQLTSGDENATHHIAKYNIENEKEDNDLSILDDEKKDEYLESAKNLIEGNSPEYYFDYEECSYKSINDEMYLHIVCSAEIDEACINNENYKDFPESFYNEIYIWIENNCLYEFYNESTFNISSTDRDILKSIAVSIKPE